MVVFEDAEDAGGKRESGTEGGRGKRRAVLLQEDRDVWTIHESDQQAAEAAAALAASEAEIVAIHPLTQEQLTHNQVVDLVHVRINMIEGMTVERFVSELNAAGGDTDQAVMDLLFGAMGSTFRGDGTTE